MRRLGDPFPAGSGAAGETADHAVGAEVHEPELDQETAEEARGLGLHGLDLDVLLLAQRAEVVEREEVRVRRVVPLERQLLADRHAAGEEQVQTDADGREVRDRDDGLAGLVEDLHEDLARLLHRLQRFGQDGQVVGAVGQEAEPLVRVLVQHVDVAAHALDDLREVDLDARAARTALTEDAQQGAGAAADVEHARAGRDHVHERRELAQLLGRHLRVLRREEGAHQAAELLRVREEAVVADLDVQVRVGDGLVLAEHRGRDRAALLLAEEPVPGEGDEQEARLDAPAGLVHGPVLDGRVVAVHRVRNLEVGVRVEAREELARLVAEIALDGEHRAEAGGVLLLPFGVARQPVLLQLAAEAAVQEVERKVGDVGDLAGLGETDVGTVLGGLVVVVAAVPVRIERDRVAADDVEGERLGVQGRARGDHDRAVDFVRMRGDPLHDLDAAEAAADEAREARHADLAQQRAVDLDRVADRETGEVAAPGPPRGGVDARGAGRALAAAEDVRADDAVAVRVDRLAGTDDALPPAGALVLAGVASRYVRVAREGVADEDDVVVLGPDEAAALPGDVDAGQRAALFQMEHAVGQGQGRHVGLDDAHAVVFLLVHGGRL